MKIVVFQRKALKQLRKIQLVQKFAENVMI
ncbi:Uncharacterised protein [Mannheimia haemolytica]|uniref:Uncharacterized protein n=1 Tax=Mannheimia haemolytica TaxID=75985 RepID=A0A378MWE9_MANHA|nr:Uncharacterised protein [Mannheimia haemolytica]